MGLYIYISKEDRIKKRQVSDPYINEEFQAALKCDPSLMIEEHTFFEKKYPWSKKSEKKRYTLYHETPAWDGTPYQARLQSSASGDKKTVVAYLHGIINGIVHYTERTYTEAKKPQ